MPTFARLLRAGMSYQRGTETYTVTRVQRLGNTVRLHHTTANGLTDSYTWLAHDTLYRVS